MCPSVAVAYGLRAIWLFSTTRGGERSSTDGAHVDLAALRLALVVRDGMVEHVFYPVFPPDRAVADVLAWLRRNPLIRR